MDWLPFLDPTHLFHLAQTPIAPPKTPEVELLRKQLDFITQANKDLNESFKTFVDTMKFVLVIFGFLGGAIAFIFGKNLDDAKKSRPRCYPSRSRGSRHSARSNRSQQPKTHPPKRAHHRRYDRPLLSSQRHSTPQRI